MEKQRPNSVHRMAIRSESLNLNIAIRHCEHAAEKYDPILRRSAREILRNALGSLLENPSGLMTVMRVYKNQNDQVQSEILETLYDNFNSHPQGIESLNTLLRMTKPLIQQDFLVHCYEIGRLLDKQALPPALTGLTRTCSGAAVNKALSYIEDAAFERLALIKILAENELKQPLSGMKKAAFLSQVKDPVVRHHCEEQFERLLDSASLPFDQRDTDIFNKVSGLVYEDDATDDMISTLSWEYGIASKNSLQQVSAQKLFEEFTLLEPAFSILLQEARRRTSFNPDPEPPSAA